jgi:maleylacetoacetate isomerase
MELYGYFRSSASYRVRIALALKGLECKSVPVHLVRDGGEQFGAAFRQLNPDALVPVLVHDGVVVRQSLAICEYLEEIAPQPSLLPTLPGERAWVRALALTIACEIHPLNNLRVLRYLKQDLQITDEARDTWYRHWVEQGLASVESMLGEGKSGRFSFGDTPGMADVFLVPQIFNARRLNCRLDHVPRVMQVFEHCMALPAFDETQPSRQPEAE